VSNAPALPSLVRLIRGLSALFWSLPLVLLLDAKMAIDDSWRTLGFGPIVAVNAVLVFGLRQLRYFQSHERVWIAAVDRAELVGWLLLALSPFPVWRNRLPEEPFFAHSLVLLVFTGLGFLLALNHVLLGLSLMIPDKTLRLETRFFSGFNRALLAIQSILLGIYLCLSRLPGVQHPVLGAILEVLELLKPWLVLLLALVPVALTMTLIWKAKEVILANAFNPVEKH
jgi:hypothetical protein